MNKIIKCLNILLNVLTLIAIIIVLIFLYGVLQKKLSGSDYYNYFGYTFFKVTSGSMEPTINVDDVIIVDITTDIKENDIITFKENNAFITHRVLKINGDNIITKGDNNNAKDVELLRNNVIGKVIYTVPKVGIIKQILLSPKIIISILVTLFLFDALFYSNFKESRDSNEE